MRADHRQVSQPLRPYTYARSAQGARNDTEAESLRRIFSGGPHACHCEPRYTILKPVPSMATPPEGLRETIGRAGEAISSKIIPETDATRPQQQSGE